MLIVVSPAKKLDFEQSSPINEYTQPTFLNDSKELIKELKRLEVTDIAKLMKLSKPLAELNFSRYQEFKTPFNLKNAKQAAFAFKGDTYIGLDFESFTSEDIEYAQKHLRILSGLYGLLRPLDLIQPYRLEMGTAFKTKNYKNLYELWQNKITPDLNLLLNEEKVLINLASKEYFSAIDFKQINAKVITPVFMEKKADKYKIISFNAKRARGMMGQYIIKNRIETSEEIKSFNMDQYKFNPKMSSDSEFVFTR